MRRAPRKSQLGKPSPVVIRIDPYEMNNGIVVPEIKYELLATVDSKQVFNGMVLPIPRVLLYYLKRHELLVVAAIIEETNNKGSCALTVKELSTRLKISTPSLSNTLYSLRRVGLLLEKPNGLRGTGRIRELNYETVQHLNDLVEGEDPGIYSRIRKASRKIDISHMTRDDIECSYDTKVLPPDHDPAEEEEYD